MPILLYRVDDRLIHGQVVIGWGQQLRPERYLIVDDRLAESEWEQELYLLGLPEGVEAEFHAVSEAREHLEEWRRSRLRSIVLLRELEAALRLAEGGTLEGESLNLGGIHHATGRVRVLSYVHLGDDDRAILREISAAGVEISARDLPGSDRVSLSRLLGE